MTGTLPERHDIPNTHDGTSISGYLDSQGHGSARLAQPLEISLFIYLCSCLLICICICAHIRICIPFLGPSSSKFLFGQYDRIPKQKTGHSQKRTTLQLLGTYVRIGLVHVRKCVAMLCWRDAGLRCLSSWHLHPRGQRYLPALGCKDLLVYESRSILAGRSSRWYIVATWRNARQRSKT